MYLAFLLNVNANVDVYGDPRLRNAVHVSGFWTLRKEGNLIKGKKNKNPISNKTKQQFHSLCGCFSFVFGLLFFSCSFGIGSFRLLTNTYLQFINHLHRDLWPQRMPGFGFYTVCCDWELTYHKAMTYMIGWGYASVCKVKEKKREPKKKVWNNFFWGVFCPYFVDSSIFFPLPHRDSWGQSDEGNNLSCLFRGR